MTLILALPATDGVALVSDTRRWFRTGGYVDGHRKLVWSLDGLITGAGSGQLLDEVAQRAARRSFPEVVALIDEVAQRGLWDGELADWMLTQESRSADDPGEHSVQIVRFDGFTFKRTQLGAGVVPTGLPKELEEQIRNQVRPVFDAALSLAELRSLSFAICADLFPSGLISPDFDFGTHRAGHRLDVERLRLPHRKPRSSQAARVAPAEK